MKEVTWSIPAPPAPALSPGHSPLCVPQLDLILLEEQYPKSSQCLPALRKAEGASPVLEAIPLAINT